MFLNGIIDFVNGEKEHLQFDGFITVMLYVSLEKENYQTLKRLKACVQWIFLL